MDGKTPLLWLLLQAVFCLKLHFRVSASHLQRSGRCFCFVFSDAQLALCILDGCFFLSFFLWSIRDWPHLGTGHLTRWTSALKWYREFFFLDAWLVCLAQMLRVKRIAGFGVGKESTLPGQPNVIITAASEMGVLTLILIGAELSQHRILLKIPPKWLIQT